MRSASIYNLGCKVNAYEAEVMAEKLTEAGYHMVPFDEGADVLVINTCTVTNTADQKSRQMIHRAKRKNPNAIIVACGCYVDTHDGKVEDVDVVLPNSRKQDIAVEIAKILEKRNEKVDKEIKKSTSIEMSSTITSMGEHTRAFVKIEDGCDSFCSYCIIPFARGRVKSRPRAEVVEEVRTLVESGYREVVLTGIQINAYGTDFPEKRRGDEELLSLMQELDAIPGLKRIRLGSLEPRITTDSFLSGIAALPSFCPHFHLSLQSGCDRTLRAMNRHYSTEEYYDVCERIRNIWPDAALTTDVIVGFPQETEEDFIESYRFVDKVRFFETHIFPYFRRAGTKADRMDGQLTKAEKEKRAAKLISLGETNKELYLSRFYGRELEVLFEEKKTVAGEEYLIGHSREYIRCGLPATTTCPIGEPVTVQAVKTENGLLICNLV